jgi:regulator of protease activity HflC (stomatin/prohibitin superfamily)
MQFNADMAERLKKSGITLYSASLIDMDAGSEIEAAITAEAVAKKAVETAEQEYLKAQTEAKQMSVKAEAEKAAAQIKAETTVIDAQAVADAKVIAAEAEAKSNKMVEESLTDNVLTNKTISAWDGKLPVVYGSEDSILDVSSLLNK